jgi:hypothetical protein
MRTDHDLYLRFDGYDELKPILADSDEDVLVALRKPTLVFIPGTDTQPRARFVSALLHGNEDSGYRAVLDMLRTGEHYPFDLWVFIGNVRAAHQEGWFAHRYLDGQEDFNRTWGLNAPTTRMRRCSDAVYEILRELDLEAAIDIHNNTGLNPYYAITPEPTQEALQLAAAMADTILRWPLRAHTLMEVLSPLCPAVSVEAGLPAVEANHAYAASALRRFLRKTSFEEAVPGPQRVFEMQHRIIVRDEVRFAFGGVLTEEMDLVLHPGMDHFNFGMLLAGTELGVVPEGAGMPLLCTDMRGRETTDRFFAVKRGSLIVTEDVTPVMLTTTVQQTRRDCFFYIARRRS